MAEEFNFITGASIEADGGRWSVVFPGAVLEIRDTLAEALDAVETVTKARADDCAAALRRIREIRASRRLGRLVWEAAGEGAQHARAGGGMLLYWVFAPPREVDGAVWRAKSIDGEQRWAFGETEAAAKAQCEEWFAEWLDRAGLEVRHGAEPSPLPWEALRSTKDPHERRMLWMAERAHLARMLESYGRQAPPWPREELLAECRNEEERAEVRAFLLRDSMERMPYATTGASLREIVTAAAVVALVAALAALLVLP